MKLNELTSGGNAKAYRKGRGRSGGGVRPGFEGGQMPLYRRLPKRGFNNKRFAPDYIIVNIADLEKFEGTEVTAAALAEQGIITLPKVNDGIKILGNGDLTKKLDVKATKFSASAKEKIEKAGGTATEV